MNTVSFYNRILRAVYNRAVEKEMTVQRYPFKHVYTGIDKTVKRALPLKLLKGLRNWICRSSPHWILQGTCFCSHFTHAECRSLTWHISRRRTCRTASFPIADERRGNNCSSSGKIHAGDYRQIPGKWKQLSAANHQNRPERTVAIQNALRLVNNKLKEISVSTGLQSKLTMYVSRHSWASIAKSQNIPLSVISAGMGHDSENTTRIYLASLDNSMIDKANELILGKLWI